VGGGGEADKGKLRPSGDLSVAIGKGSSQAEGSRKQIRAIQALLGGLVGSGWDSGPRFIY
jgi:hypothetical protein